MVRLSNMLSIVATPIGNMEDITLRALRTLREADLILAEDTRHIGLLLKHYEIPHKPLLPFYDEVEKNKTKDLLATINSEKKVVLVSDAGTPLISDPGFKLVRAAIKEGTKIEAVPGPTAAITALILSGLPPDKFLFLGFPPEKPSHQAELYLAITQLYHSLKATVIFFVSPHKLQRNLELLLSTAGDREIVIARELTKVYEEIWRGTISEAQMDFKNPRGELVLLFNWGE